VDLLTGTHGDRLLAVIGGRTDPVAVLATMADSFGPGAIVVGPVVDGIAAAGRSARAAISGFRAAAAWPSAPRPVAADDLLPERALAGDPVARRQLVDEVYAPLAAVPAVFETVTTYLEQALSVEATARTLFVHPNTVRYRLRRAADLAGQVPTTARGGYTVRTAVALGRLANAYRP
jgi:DNA-binding PucR family transcriptional regulator